ncbi:flagellar basal body-associated FliL family protein [Nocardioides okcheonensis]|uniref:flagellar basal body-associated FliL family protein n=1 Tax=Nocardioides okcheonensis TaxID=2894081 RepID=UPI001E365820|nr:flagellar basal body-associated FliL family protein [Nocardioides okcheonensis]UFN43201.1 flagellar basal body-associated FliL family protein [Nocardioides okcheonensis]
MSSATLEKPAEAEAEAKGGKKKLIIIVVVLLVAAAAGYWFFLKPSGAPKEPEPGEVMTMEPIQVNLADGHYLRIGVALQLTADAHEADGSKALDATIALFSGVDQAELIKDKQREELKKELEKELEHAYHGDVMEVYFTEFVTQ